MGTEARKTQRFILVVVNPEDNLLGFKDSVCVWGGVVSCQSGVQDGTALSCVPPRRLRQTEDGG